MNFFPLFLRLDDARKVLIVGGGAVALAKAETVTPYADVVKVVAKQLSPGMKAFLKKHAFDYIEEAYQPEHLEGVGLVIAASDDEMTNRRIYHDAKRRGILANVVDVPELCDVIFPAIVRRGPLQIAISSSGVSPVMARLVKQGIEKLLPWNYEQLIHFIRTRRGRVKNMLPTLQKRRLLWHDVIEGSISEAVLEGNTQQADALFEEALQDVGNTDSHGALYLIGAGPGHPDLLTVKAIRLLSRADVVLYDRLVAPDILTMYARTEAKKICVGKTRDFHLKSQEQIDRLLEEYLKAGKIVVRLKGGDPSLYAHGAEEIAVANRLGVPYQIVPGITAATGCAAAAGIPLTERGGAQAVRFLTLYKDSFSDVSYWNALRSAQEETLVFYMSTNHRVLLCHKLIEYGFDPETPILAVEQGTTPSHKEYEGTLASFPELYGEHPFVSPTLLIVGDVVRWRAQHGWKQNAEEALPFFTELEGKKAYVLH